MKNRKLTRAILLAAALFMSACGKKGEGVVQYFETAAEACKSGDEDSLKEAIKRAEKEIEEMKTEAEKNGPTAELVTAGGAYDGTLALADIYEAGEALEHVSRAIKTGEIEDEAKQYQNGNNSNTLTLFIEASANMASADGILTDLEKLDDTTLNSAIQKGQDALETVSDQYNQLSSEVQSLYDLSEEQMEYIMSVEGMPGWDSKGYKEAVKDFSLDIQVSEEDIEKATKKILKEIEKGSNGTSIIGNFMDALEYGYSDLKEKVEEGAEQRYDEANDLTQKGLDWFKKGSAEQRKYDETHPFGEEENVQ